MVVTARVKADSADDSCGLPVYGSSHQVVDAGLSLRVRLLQAFNIRVSANIQIIKKVFETLMAVLLFHIDVILIGFVDQ